MAQVTLPQGAPGNTAPSEFLTVTFAGVVVGGIENVDFTEMHPVDFIGQVGTDDVLEDPGVREGRGTFQKAVIFGNTLRDIMIQQQVVTAAQLAANGIDFRFLSFTATFAYQDGANKKTATLTGLKFVESGWRVQGTRLVREYGSIKFRKRLDS